MYCLFTSDINECLSSPCNHTCTNTAGSFVCSCNDGYELGPDGLSCHGMTVQSLIPLFILCCFSFLDIDECSTTFPCSQNCTNTLGSFQCSCNSGYTLDGTRCNGQ